MGADPVHGGRVLVTGAAGMLGSQLLLDAPGDCMAVGTDLAAAPDGSGGHAIHSPHTHYRGAYSAQRQRVMAVGRPLDSGAAYGKCIWTTANYTEHKVRAAGGTGQGLCSSAATYYRLFYQQVATYPASRPGTYTVRITFYRRNILDSQQKRGDLEA